MLSHLEHTFARTIARTSWLCAHTSCTHVQPTHHYARAMSTHTYKIIRTAAKRGNIRSTQTMRQQLRRRRGRLSSQFRTNWGRITLTFARHTRPRCCFVPVHWCVGLGAPRVARKRNMLYEPLVARQTWSHTSMQVCKCFVHLPANMM